MSSTTQTITIASPNTRAKELAMSARRLLDDLKVLEAGMIASNDCKRPRRTSSLSPSTSRRRTPSRRTPSTSLHHQSLFACQPLVDHSSSVILAKAIKKKRVTGAFMTFCEHLLFMNHVWKQQRQLQILKASIKETEKAKCSNAFKSFCDRLLLTNRIWQLERQIEELTAEGEKNKRAREAAITHAAKQMAVDVRKESMIEEFVLDLIRELQDSKQLVAELRGEHEREVREIQGDWLKEYRRLARENERLELEKHARLVEQDVSNELEQSLFDNLVRSRLRVWELEQGDGDSTLVGDAFDRGSVSFSRSSTSLDGDVTEFDEGMSTMSSSTCVSFQEFTGGPGKSRVLGVRQRCASVAGRIHPKSLDASLEKRRLLRRQSMQPRKIDTTPYAGFSFNPLFFGNPETLVVSPSRAEETPMKVALKVSPPFQTAAVKEREGSMLKAPRLAGPTGAKGPWKF